jgi:hypothetical protein
MAYTTIDKGSSYFNGLAYTGTNTSTAYNNGLDMSTNGGLVWLKVRNSTGDHGLFDSVRGTTKRLRSNTTDVEDTLSGLTSFNSTGFTLGTAYNDTPYTFMSWSWIAGGTGVSNTSGSITSTVSANTTSGFSIVSYTGNATSAQTIGHGLGVAPKMMIIKNRINGSNSWYVYHSSIGATKRLFLNLTLAQDNADASIWNSTAPTSTVFSVGADGGVNGSTNGMIAYCFAEIKGFSKFGSYTGNGSTDGTFVYTGFTPAFVMLKASSSTSQWGMLDNKRNTFNPTAKELQASLSDAETDYTNRIDILSNGFKLRTTTAQNNSSGVTYIYMAFAENPFVSSKGLPTTAR